MSQSEKFEEVIPWTPPGNSWNVADKTLQGRRNLVPTNTLHEWRAGRARDRSKQGKPLSPVFHRFAAHALQRSGSCLTLLRSNPVKFCNLRYTEGQSGQTNGLLWA